MEKVYLIYCKAGNKNVMCTNSSNLAYKNARILNENIGIKKLYTVQEIQFINSIDI